MTENNTNYENFKIGNIYTEMLSYWLYIVYNDPISERVGILEVRQTNHSFIVLTYEEFKRKYTYSSEKLKGQYYITFLRNDYDTTKEIVNDMIENKLYSDKPQKIRESNILKILTDV